MGYRWECSTCNDPFTIYEVVRHVKGTFTCWDLESRDEHQKENPTHHLWGGWKVWRYPDGTHQQQLYKVIDEEQELWKEWCDEIKLLKRHKNQEHLYLTSEDGWTSYKEGKYERPELGELIDNRKPKPPSRKQGCPKCGKSENIRYVSKGKLICKACDLVFEKGEKK